MSLTSQLVMGILLTALVVGPAAAQTDGDADPVEALAAQGLECFQKRDFSCAVDKYLEAYRIEPVAALLYNIAFIYDKKFDDSPDNLRLARDYYFRYAKAPDPDPETKLAALERIIEIDSMIKLPPPVPTPATPPKKIEPDNTLLYAGWATVGVGVVLAGVGGTFGLLASQAADTQSTTTDPAEWNDIRDSAPTQALIGDIGMAAGGAAIVTGLILVLTHDDGTGKPAETGSDVKVAPSASGLGLSIGGTF